jgi:hypothetical protein
LVRVNVGTVHLTLNAHPVQTVHLRKVIEVGPGFVAAPTEPEQLNSTYLLIMSALSFLNGVKKQAGLKLTFMKSITVVRFHNFRIGTAEPTSLSPGHEWFVF